MRVILTALAIPGFALAVAIAGAELMKDDTLAQPASIVWADRAYTDKRDLAKWLRARGATYKVWAARHAAAAQVLERRASLASAESRHFTIAIGILLGSAGGMLALVIALEVGVPVAAGRKRAQTVGVRQPPTSRRRMPRTPTRANQLAARTRLATFAGLARLKTRLAGAPQRAHGLRHDPPLVGRPVLVAQRRASLSTLTATWVAASRRARARVDDRLWTRFLGYDRVGDYHAMYAREEVRRRRPEIALYLTSVLLACVIGASIALYLN